MSRSLVGRSFSVGSSVVVVALLSGCSGPPLKEYHQARGALDAARAADAERYAPEDFRAGGDALKQYDVAVAQRDYRLALNYALEAYNRAQAAAKTAANEKAAVRSRVEAALAEAGRSVATGRLLLQKAAAARIPPARLAEARRTLTHVTSLVQKARKALEAGEYLEASNIIKGADEQGRRAVSQLEIALRPPPARRRR
ncbi:MAG: DUF4398 domain-containing protein [Acidobacteria bacterium]|nr:DUF4398 domain-containing protein [Acidobacteriota bacterium]